MPQHSEISIVPYGQADMFSLVADVKSYPDFLPWCAGLRIKRKLKVKGKPVLYCDMIVAYQLFREQFSSRVTLDEPGSILVEYLDGPFEYLTNRWGFRALEDGRTEVDFHIDFEFQRAVYQKAIAPVFERAVLRMIDAFGQEARKRFVPLAGFAHPELPSDQQAFGSDL